MTFKNKMIFITMISIVSIIIMAATATIVIRTKNYENSEKWILTQQRLINSIEYQYRCYHTEMKVWDILFKVENINDSTIFQIQSTRERAKEFLHNAFLYEVDESGKKIIEDLKILNKQYEDNIYKVLTFLENEQQEEAIALFLSDEHQKTRNDMQELAHRLQDLQFSEFIKLIENSREYISNVTRIILLTSLIIVIGSIGLTGWLLRSFTLNVNNLTNVLNKASISPASNLQRIKVITNDEIGHIAKAYNHLVDSLEFHIKQEHEYKRVLQEKNWMQSKIAEIDAIFHEVENLNNLAEAIVSKTTPLIKANYRIFFFSRIYPSSPNSHGRCSL